MAKSHQNTREDDKILEIAEIIQVSAITIQMISILSIFRNQMLDEIVNPAQPKHTSVLSGQQYTQEILSSKSEARILECLHMQLPVFMKLCEMFRQYRYLRDTENTTIEHRVHIFIYIVTNDSSN